MKMILVFRFEAYLLMNLNDPESNEPIKSAILRQSNLRMGKILRMGKK